MSCKLDSIISAKCSRTSFSRESSIVFVTLRFFCRRGFFNVQNFLAAVILEKQLNSMKIRIQLILRNLGGRNLHVELRDPSTKLPETLRKS